MLSAASRSSPPAASPNRVSPAKSTRVAPTHDDVPPPTSDTPLADVLLAAFRPARPATTPAGSSPHVLSAAASAAAVRDAIAMWTTTHRVSPARAVRLILNFSLAAAGFPEPLSTGTSTRDIAFDAADVLAHLLRSLSLDDILVADYPLVARAPRAPVYWSAADAAAAAARTRTGGNSTAIAHAIATIPVVNGPRFKKIFVDFWTQWVRMLYSSDILLDQDLLEEIGESTRTDDEADRSSLGVVLSWLIQMSSSNFRPFRHTATVAALAIASALTDIAQKLWKKWSTLSLQLDLEESRKQATHNNQRSAKIQRLEQDIAALEEVRGPIEDHLAAIQEMVFSLRYHDSDPAIRQDSLTELGHWIVKYPAMYMDNKFLRHLGWTLSDKVGAVRLTSLRTLRKLYETESLLDGIREFSVRFRPRMVEMALGDRDSHVRAEATALLCEVLFQKGLLEDTDRDRMSLLMFHSDTKIRDLVAPLAVARINDTMSEFAEEHGFTELIDEDQWDESTHSVLNAWYHNAVAATVLKISQERDQMERTEAKKLIKNIDGLAVFPQSHVDKLIKSDFFETLESNSTGNATGDHYQKLSFESWLGSPDDSPSDGGRDGSQTQSHITMENVDLFIRSLHKVLPQHMSCSSIIEFLSDAPAASNVAQVSTAVATIQSESDAEEESHMLDDDNSIEGGKRRSSRISNSQSQDISRRRSIGRKTKRARLSEAGTNSEGRPDGLELTAEEETCLLYMLNSYAGMLSGLDVSSKKMEAISSKSISRLPRMLMRFSLVDTSEGASPNGNLLAFLTMIEAIPLGMFFAHKQVDVLKELRRIVFERVIPKHLSDEILTVTSSLIRSWTPKDAKEANEKLQRRDSGEEEGSDDENQHDVHTTATQRSVYDTEIMLFMEDTHDLVVEAGKTACNEINVLLSEVNTQLIIPLAKGGASQLDKREYVASVQSLFDTLTPKVKRIERLYSRAQPLLVFNIDSIREAATAVQNKSAESEHPDKPRVELKSKEDGSSQSSSSYEVLLALFDTASRAINYSVNVLGDFAQAINTSFTGVSDVSSGRKASNRHRSLIREAAAANFSIQRCISASIKLNCQLAVWETFATLLFKPSEIAGVDSDKQEAENFKATVHAEICSQITQMDQLSLALITSKEIRIDDGLQLSAFGVFCCMRNLESAISDPSSHFTAHIRTSWLRNMADSVDVATRHGALMELNAFKQGQLANPKTELVKIQLSKVAVDYLRILALRDESTLASMTDTNTLTSNAKPARITQSIDLLWALCPFINIETPLLDQSGIFRLIKLLLSKLDLGTPMLDDTKSFNRFALNCFLVDFKSTLRTLRLQDLNVSRFLISGQSIAVGASGSQSSNNMAELAGTGLESRVACRKDFLFVPSCAGMPAKDKLTVTFRFIRWWFMGRNESHSNNSNQTAEHASRGQEDPFCFSLVSEDDLRTLLGHAKESRVSGKDDDPDYLSDSEFGGNALDARDRANSAQVPFNTWCIAILLRHKLADKMLTSLEKLVATERTIYQRDKSIQKDNVVELKKRELSLQFFSVFISELLSALGRRA